MINKKKINKDLLTISVLSTITVFTWIGFNTLRIIKKTVIPKVLKEQMQPVNPNFNTKLIEKIKQRRVISQNDLDTVPELNQFVFNQPEESTEENNESTESANQKNQE